jgi:hypothetical protein
VNKRTVFVAGQSSQVVQARDGRRARSRSGDEDIKLGVEATEELGLQKADRK